MSEPNTPPHARPPALHRRWFAELKRRRVFRVVAVYGAVSFVVLEVADLVFPAIPLPAWSVSLVLWLVILGFPFAVVLSWAFELTPEGVRWTEAAPPEEIEAIASAPASARWPSGLLALGGLALLVGAFYVGWRSGSTPGGEGNAAPVDMPSAAGVAFVDPAEDSRPAIAVLPFTDMSPDSDQEYFSDGISEEILTVLSKIRDLRVAARASAFTYKGSDLDLRRVGAELGVPFLLGGSVRKDGDQLRITAELVSTADLSRVWAESYDRRLDNVFAIQTEIAEAVSAALRVPLGLSRDDLVSPTLDMDAHDLFLSGRAAMRRRGPGVGEAIRLFEAAVSMDPGWAPAWAALAEAHAINPLYTGEGREYTDSATWARSLAAAKEAARRALTLDPQNASARVALGNVHTQSWEWEQGEREFLAALAIDPDNHEAHTQYAELLWGMGRMDESLRESGRALALDRAPIRLDVHGFTSLMNGRIEEGEALLEEGLAMDTAGDVHYLRTVFASQMLIDGRYREALDRFAFYLPDTAGYRAMGEALENADTTRLAGATGRGLAQTWMLLGYPERALDVLEEMVFAMPFRVQYDLWDPVFAPLRQTPRFQDVILPRVNLVGRQASYAAPGGGS